MDKNFLVEKISELGSDTADQIRALTKQLNDVSRALTDEDIRSMLDSPCNFLFGARDTDTNKVVGMATLIVYRIPYAKKSILEDVVVDVGYRGQGIGTLLLEKALEIAKKERVAYIDLTSRPSREEGNRLYTKFGFEKRDTNVYRLKITEGKSL